MIIGQGKMFGKGVFANRDFKKGDIVIRYKLKPLTEHEFEHLPEIGFIELAHELQARMLDKGIVEGGPEIVLIGNFPLHHFLIPFVPVQGLDIGIHDRIGIIPGF